MVLGMRVAQSSIAIDQSLRSVAGSLIIHGSLITFFKNSDFLKKWDALKNTTSLRRQPNYSWRRRSSSNTYGGGDSGVAAADPSHWYNFCGISVDFNFYKTFWSLQEHFFNPGPTTLGPTKWQKFASNLMVVLDTFEAQPLNDDDGNANNIEEEAATFSIKYLTSSKLMGLELKDPGFRRHILVQCLILFDYLKVMIFISHVGSIDLLVAVNLLYMLLLSWLLVLDMQVIRGFLHICLEHVLIKCHFYYFCPFQYLSTVL
ncbi:uncharacterized protein LOC122645210 [Telopea speciosissima]|uniref:uncharacterized protein LOC122645210 n=1 Tax=Telopea speciosissima TaxID=54955 RepID=UPI001CC55844|nr:uncharacterized protein LOC122645210 [Telopea speciosissima]